MAVRVYILPIERVGIYRGPKYFAWRFSVGGIVCPWQQVDYGLVDFAVLAADVTDPQHTSVSGNADVLALPLNLDSTLTGGSVTSTRDFLEAFNIPANWITGGQTWRSLLRTVTGMFLYVQRVTAIVGETLDFQAVPLNAQINDFPQVWQTALAQAAADMGFDYTGITGATTVRILLKTMADAWGARPIIFDTLLTL